MRRFTPILVLIAALFITTVVLAWGVIGRVSVDSSATQGNDHSHAPRISADGRYVAFSSMASNLVTGDTNGDTDVFVHDRSTGDTTRVSVDSSATQGNDHSHEPSISADGRYVAFSSMASNLVTGDTNGATDIFVHDRTTGTTTRVSVDSSATQGNDHSYEPSISADGRYVAFWSDASNLVTGDTNGLKDVFVHDRSTGTTTRVSVDSGGNQGNNYSCAPSISSDGRYVAFYSIASNLVTGDTNGDVDVFVHNRSTDTTTRVFLDSSGTQSNGHSYSPSISADGRYVAFYSYATNLVSGDTNGVRDIFVTDKNPTSSETAVNDDPSVLPATGFARGSITGLPEQPADKAFASTTMLLDIPSLNKEIAIVGVPQVGDSWDVTWLGDQAGYLEGTAFPTWAGNTVLTGHVWDAYNEPGPFAALKTLKYGNTFSILAWGQTYTYEVRESKLVRDHNLDAVMCAEDHDWVTLLTCEFYNPLTGEYLSRRMVRGVLVNIE